MARHLNALTIGSKIMKYRLVERIVPQYEKPDIVTYWVQFQDQTGEWVWYQSVANSGDNKQRAINLYNRLCFEENNPPIENILEQSGDN